MIRAFAKRLVRATPWGRLLHDSGFFSEPADNRRVIGISFFVQKIVGLHRRCPWLVHYSSRVMQPDRIQLGRNVYKSVVFSGGCYIQGTNGIEIGDGTVFAPGVKLISANHNMEDLDCHVAAEPLRIGRDCWIGANAVILPGVQLGDGVCVGAGAVVTKSFPAGATVAGNPAKVIRKR